MANTTNFGWETPDDTDLVKDGAAAIRTLGSAIDTSLADLEGGTTGQILAKNSNTDMDFVWVTNDVGDITAITAGTGLTGGGTSGAVSLAIDTATTVDLSTAQTLTNKTLTSPVLTTPTISTIDAKGDLLAGTADNTIGRLAVGANNTVLTADSATATGLKWATPSAGGGMTLLQSLSLSGSSVTSSTLSSSYKQFVIYWKGASVAASNQYVNFRLNGDTGSNYGWTFSLISGTSNAGNSVGSNATSCRFALADVLQTDYAAHKGILTITRPSDTDYIFWDFNGWGREQSSSTNQLIYSAGTYDGSAAITSITFFPDSSTFDNGTAEIYGVN